MILHLQDKIWFKQLVASKKNPELLFYIGFHPIGCIYDQELSSKKEQREQNQNPHLKV